MPWNDHAVVYPMTPTDSSLRIASNLTATYYSSFQKFRLLLHALNCLICMVHTRFINLNIPNYQQMPEEYCGTLSMIYHQEHYGSGRCGNYEVDFLTYPIY